MQSAYTEEPPPRLDFRCEGGAPGRRILRIWNQRSRGFTGCAIGARTPSTAFGSGVGHLDDGREVPSAEPFRCGAGVQRLRQAGQGQIDAQRVRLGDAVTDVLEHVVELEQW